MLQSSIVISHVYAEHVTCCTDVEYQDNSRSLLSSENIFTNILVNKLQRLVDNFNCANNTSSSLLQCLGLSHFADLCVYSSPNFDQHGEYFRDYIYFNTCK